MMVSSIPYICGGFPSMFHSESVVVKDGMLICLGGESWAVH